MVNCMRRCVEYMPLRHCFIGKVNDKNFARNENKGMKQVRPNSHCLHRNGVVTPTDADAHNNVGSSGCLNQFWLISTGLRCRNR